MSRLGSLFLLIKIEFIALCDGNNLNMHTTMYIKMNVTNVLYNTYSIKINVYLFVRLFIVSARNDGKEGFDTSRL